MRLCAIKGCGVVHFCKGYCRKHYKRFAKGQDPEEERKGQQSIERGGLAKLGLHKHHPFYMAWVNMKTRCDNIRSTQYPWYGARGIHYDERWSKFKNFYEDMWPSWSEGRTLERLRNDENYSKNNCCWATMYEQAQNRRAWGASYK